MSEEFVTVTRKKGRRNNNRSVKDDSKVVAKEEQESLAEGSPEFADKREKLIR